jgi:hypothetical protein
MKTTLAHVEEIRLENESIRAKVQRVLGLSDEAYCELQFEFYLKYLKGIFPSDSPEAERCRKTVSNSAEYRMWFTERWNLKDSIFFNQLSFDGDYPEGVLCAWTREKQSASGVYVLSTFIQSKEVLYQYYVLQHMPGQYDTLPATLLRKIFSEVDPKSPFATL